MRPVANRGGLRRALGLLLAGCLLAGGGCTRAFYRRAADKEVNDVLAEKDKYPQWRIAQWHVYPDPRARFGDPTNPDRPPMPPDDPAAWDLSPHPQHPGHAGIGDVHGTAYLEMMKAWDTQNRAAREAAKSSDKQAGGPPAAPYAPTSTPPPTGGGGAGVGGGKASEATSRSGPLQTYFDDPLKSEGLLLDLDQTVELGLVNSREYQFFREELYLAALPVTLQRFSFAYQLAAIENAVRLWGGPDSVVGHQNNWTLNTSASASKLFSTGALLTFQFANNTVFNFLQGSSPLTSTSSIDLTLMQPLLRGGGRAVTLEPLTQVERNLVYDIRAYARFREQFYLSLALGTSLPSSLAFAVGTGPISTLAALGIASTDVAGQFRGYLPSLFREFDLAVDRKYVADLEVALRRFEGLEEGGQVAPLQVSQVRTSLLNARNAVLKDRQDTTNALDQFKLQLGIPANTPLILDDAPGRPMTRQLDRYYEVQGESEAAFNRVEAQQGLAPAELRPFLRRLFTTDPLVRGTEFRTKVLPAWDALAKRGSEELEALLQKRKDERRRLLDRKTDLEMKGKGLSAADALQLRESGFELDLGGLEQTLREYEARPWEKLPKDKREQRLRMQSARFRLTSYAAGNVLVYARNDRFDKVGTLWPEAPKARLGDVDLLTLPVEQAEELAVQSALTDRVELMNVRAQVVDAWRQLRVTANALMGVFNVTGNLHSITKPGGTNPLAFSPGRTNASLTLNAQLPLVRVAERNAYRTALIDYQRARRNLMNLEDSVAAQLRFDVRQLHLFAANYKIQQKIIEGYYTQVENSLEVIVAPVDPQTLTQSTTQAAANAAALTNQYLGALGNLNNAQTRLYDLWLSYLATRMQLFLDLERLPLDLRGVWTDESGNPIDDPHATVTAPCLGQPVAPAEGGPAAVGGAALGQPRADGERGSGPDEPLPPPRLLPPAAGPGLE
jgi:hypothetical protein